MEAVVTKSTKKGLNRRWFRRTNVYIAEYILMLVLMGSFLGILAFLWFSFFTLLYSAYGSYLPGELVLAQVGALLAVGPVAFLMYSRVTGQEMVQPELYKSKSRTVFLTIWLFFAVLALVGVIAAVFSTLFTLVLGLNSMFLGAVLVTTVIPGIFAAATLLFGIAMVAKRASRNFVMQAALVLAISMLVLIIANVTMVVIHKESYPRVLPSLNQRDCASSAYDRYYMEGQCDDLQDFLHSSPNSSSYYNNY